MVVAPGPFDLYLVASLPLVPLEVGQNPNGRASLPVAKVGAAVDPDARAPVGVAGSAGVPPPPKRLLSFALPSRVELSEDNVDRPCTVSFCLTGAQGDRIYGCSMSVVQDSDGYSLWCVVVLSCWPLVEVYKALLHSLFACRELFGLGSPDDVVLGPLVSFVDRAREQMIRVADELRFVNEHPLWCGVSLQPFFKALKWDAVDVSLLVLCLLTDQRVLLHSARRELLYPAAVALKSLIAPMQVAGVYIPYLPSVLLSAAETETLLNDTMQPYLIGCETALWASLPYQSSEIVIVDLDLGTVRQPEYLTGQLTFAALLQMRAVRDLCSNLQEGMGDVVRFRAPHIQAACLGFVLGFCDVFGGALAATSSKTTRDISVAETLGVLGEFSSDVVAQFARSGTDSVGCGQLRRAIRSAEASLFPRLAASLMQGCAVDQDVTPLLEHVWKSMPFNVWWQDREETGVIPHLLQHRTETRVLREYVREHLNSLRLVEAKVGDGLQTMFAEISGGGGSCTDSSSIATASIARASHLQ